MADHAALVRLSEQLVVLARKLHLIDAFDDRMLAGSPDGARKILRLLRSLQGIDESLEEWLDRGSAQEQHGKIDNIHQLLCIYAVQLRDALKTYPMVARDPVIIDATSASAAMTLAILEYTLITLPDGHGDIPTLEQLLDHIPQAYELRINQPVQRLLDALALGIERLSGVFTDERSPADRLADIGARIHTAANQLRSVDTLKPPAREESIELAREILRRLKGFGFGGKTLREMIDTGKPNDNAVFAHKVEEAVDSYQTLVQEAAQGNPDLLNDPDIKEANDTAGSFAHGVKLMAAKELPSSAAAAQQISADITQMPEEWKNMQDRTVDRLLKNMDSGVERVVQDIEMQQAQQEKVEEQAQSAAEAVASEGTDRRRRRRSGLGAAKQRRLVRDITADDYVLKQGRFANQDSEKKPDRTPPAFAGLSSQEIDAIKALGSALRNLGNQASTLMPPAMPVPDIGIQDNKMGKDDKGFAQQVKEQRPRQAANTTNRK